MITSAPEDYMPLTNTGRGRRAGSIWGPVPPDLMVWELSRPQTLKYIPDTNTLETYVMGLAKVKSNAK